MPVMLVYHSFRLHLQEKRTMQRKADAEVRSGSSCNLVH